MEGGGSARGHRVEIRMEEGVVRAVPHGGRGWGPGRVRHVARRREGPGASRNLGVVACGRRR
jgi:hypothetical protein